MSHLGGVRLEAIELDLYKATDTEIIVPRRYGQPTTAKSSSGVTASKLTLEQVRSAFPDDKTRALFDLLCNRWVEGSHQIDPGTKGASFKARIGSDLHPIFWAYPNRWGLEPLFGELEKRGTPPETISEYRKTIASLAAFDPNKVQNQKFTSAKFENLTQEQVAKFANASIAVVDAWRKAVQ
jgi:hypothetical protein